MKHNKFSKFIERALICLPLLYIGVQAAYIAFNPNAKDSYYGETINNVDYVKVNNASEFIYNDYYHYDSSQYVSGGVNGNLFTCFARIENLNTDYPTLINLDNVKSFSFTFYTYDYVVFNYIDNTNTAIRISDYYVNFDFYYESITNNVYFDAISKIDYNDYSYLNNALPYAMSEFNKLGFGKLDFTSWFVNIFHSGSTNVYITFVNSYLNYFLFVECCYFIPMILYWFIHFGERVIDKFSNKEY